MADITIMNPGKDAAFTQSAPYGNTTNMLFTLVTAAGILAGGDSKAVIADGDVVVLGDLPAGFRIDKVTAVLEDAFTASTTFDIGFRYSDGVDDSDVPEDDNLYFNDLNGVTPLGFTAQAAAAAKILTLPKDAQLIVTVTTEQDTVGILKVLVTGVLQGE